MDFGEDSVRCFCLLCFGSGGREAFAGGAFIGSGAFLFSGGGGMRPVWPPLSVKGGLVLLPLLLAVAKRIFWGFRAFGWPLFSSSPFWMLRCWISLTALLLMRFDAVGWFSARGRTKSMNLTAEFSSRASLAAFPCVESDY